MPTRCTEAATCSGRNLLFPFSWPPWIDTWPTDCWACSCRLSMCRSVASIRKVGVIVSGVPRCSGPPVCTENLIRVDAVMESPKLAE
jgi:hypothetical protein